MIVLVAVVIIGGDEVLLRALNVPQYILPKPSQIVTALFTEWPNSVAAPPHDAL